MEDTASEGACDAYSKPEPEAVLNRAASASRRRAAFERLTKERAPCAWKVGDRVQVRDKLETEKSEDAPPGSRLASLRWNSGRVVALSPVRVQLDGGRKGYEWHEIQAAPPRRPVADSQEASQELGKDECPNHHARGTGRPASARGRCSSAEKAQRARSLSRRRRKKEWQVRSKEREQEAQCSRVLISETSRQLPLPQVAKQPEKLSKLTQCIEEWREETEAGNELTERQLFSRLHTALLKKGLKLQDLTKLPVKDRKRLLEKLRHPLPNAVASQQDFGEWLQQKVWSQRAKADERLAKTHEKSLQRLADTEQVTLIRTLHDRVEEAKNALEEDGKSFDLAQLLRILTAGDRKFKIDDLKFLPSKDFKKLMESTGMSVAGLTKNEIMNQIHRKDWFRRARSIQPKDGSKQAQALEQLATGSHHDDLAILRELLDSQNEDMPQDVLELDRLLGKLNMPTECLTYLRIDELKPLMGRLGLVYPGSKAECVTLLHQQMWSARAVKRQPSGHHLETLERLCEPFKQTAVSCSSVTRKNGCDVDEEFPSADSEEYDDDLPLPMQYDMFIPQDC
eukprot:TRINITY_DN12148_c0_g1_i1.p1 TRINITY_DN12148_c0_g1~~TRINITY_DN12148_c0_g1_i1.p1  ORF type:complete len:568 (-),score=139.41 TRINITY_DN12148_c0_g1_i1:55-1758(-)